MCWAAQEGFDSDARTPGAARQFVGAQLRWLVGPVRDAEPIDDVELVVSELVTNAVRAGAETVLVRVRVHHGELELDVTDDGPGWPRLVQPGEQDPHGRGLVLVDALADHWHAERLDGGGKRVTVVIGLPTEFTRSLQCERPRAGLAERQREG